MEVIGILVVIVIAMLAAALLLKHQRAVGFWMQTPRYNKEYAIKMLKRQIEDNLEEIERLGKES